MNKFKLNQVYAPTSAHLDTEIKLFYGKLQILWVNVIYQYKINNERKL